MNIYIEAFSFRHDFVCDRDCKTHNYRDFGTLGRIKSSLSEGESDEKIDHKQYMYMYDYARPRQIITVFAKATLNIIALTGVS